MAYRPKHFKIHCSIQNHQKTLGLFDDDALLAMYVRAGIMAIERFADRTGDSFLLSGMDLERLAGCRGVANARRKLGRLEASSRLTLGQEGAGYRLTFPNLSRKQGFQTEADRKLSTSSSSSSSPTPTSKKRESTVPPAPPASPATPVSKSNGKSRRILIPKPDLFPGDSMDRLRVWGDKHGFGQRVLNAGLEVFREWVPVKPPYLRPIETWEGAFKKITRDGVADGKIKLTGDAAKPKGLAYAEWTGHGDEVAR